MTDNEIIKALEEELGTALIINHRFEESNDTENPDDHRFIALLSRTIKLINRQKAEIERLEKHTEMYHEVRAEAVKEFANELYRVFAGHSDYHGDTILTKIACLAEGKAIKCAESIDTNNIQAEAVKEFEERAIKNICEKVYAPTPVQSCIVEKCNQVIIEIAKEMVGADGD